MLSCVYFYLWILILIIVLQIVLDSDGSVIEEFEVLSEIASRTDMVKFMMLPDGMAWTNPNCVSSDSGHSFINGKIHTIYIN